MRNLLIFSVLLLTILVNPFITRGQRITDSVFSAGLFSVNYAFQFPGGDLADRFGPNSEIGGSYKLKTRNNWLIGFQGGYIFGEKVKEDNIFRNISTSEGYIIDQGGTFGEVYLYERGYHFMGTLGKLVPLGKPNPNSGLLVELKAGYLSHKIRIENPNKGVTQLAGDYSKGYDRLTGGFCASQFLGYAFFSNNKLLNFFGGFECTEAWTQSLREYDFDNRSKDTRKRLDLFLGFKVGWIIPFYRKTGTVFYYY